MSTSLDTTRLDVPVCHMYALEASVRVHTLHRATPVSRRSIKFSTLMSSSGYSMFSHSAKSSFIAYKYSSLDLNGRYDRVSFSTGVTSISTTAETSTDSSYSNSYFQFFAKTVSWFIDLILMDPCIVDYLVEITTRCSFVIEFIINK